MKAPLSNIQRSWKHLLSASFLFPSLSSAITLSFGPANGSPATIPGSGITYTTTQISGGPGTHAANSGSVTDTIGGTYNGTFFDPLVDGDETLTTLISGEPRANIDKGSSNNYVDYVGLCVEFSAPIEMFAFGFLDLDGQEWSSSFAYNSTTMMTFAPAVTLGTTELTSTTTTVDWGGLTGAPMTNPVVVADNGPHDPDDPGSQIVYDYDGELITNLYFLFGINNNAGTNEGTQNSGVTGFVVIEPTPPIPEPSSTALFLLGGAAIVLRRRR